MAGFPKEGSFLTTPGGGRFFQSQRGPIDFVLDMTIALYPY